MKTVKDLVADYLVKCTITAEQVASITKIPVTMLPTYELKKSLVPVTRSLRYDIDDVTQFLSDCNDERKNVLTRQKSISDNEQPGILSEITRMPDEIKVAKLSAYIAILEQEIRELESDLTKERSKNERLRNHI